MSLPHKLRHSLPVHDAVRGAGIAATACLAIAAASTAYAGSGLVPLKAISLPAGVVSFDISYVDPAAHTYVLGDRTNNGVDVIDTRTNTLSMIAGQGLFRGVVAVCAVPNSCSGPNGALIVNATTDSSGNITGGEIWAGDAGTGNPGPNQFSTVKVLSLTTGALIANINTGGQFRTDEMCFDPKDNLVMAANNADTPPFASIMNASTKTVVAKIPFPNNTNGAEQCVYNPRTGLFYITAPELNGPGDGSAPGGISVIDPKLAAAQNGATSTVPVVATYVLPLSACDTPQGMAVGPTPQMLVGCNGGPASAQSNDASVVINDGSTGGTPGSVIAELQNQDGPDMVWYDPSSRLYLLARSTKTLTNTTGQLGIVSATTFVADTSIPSVALSGGAHSVASDAASRNAYFPVPKASAASGLCSSVGGVDANGCILVLTRQVSNTHDLNADTTSDVLFRDTSGNVGAWQMQATNCSNTQVAKNGVAPIKSTNVFGQVPLTWSIVGQRDLVGNGSSSILWRDTTGDFSIWLMNSVVNSTGSPNVCGLTGGGQIAGVTTVGTIPTTWSVVGTGEFNANGMGDILWQDNQGNLAVMLMNGGTVTSSRSIGKVPAGYTVLGADRKGWVFLNNPTTNDLTIWVVNCPENLTTCTVGVTDIGSTTSQFSIKGIGDLDGNGFSDIILEDANTNVGAWFLGVVNGNPAFLSATVYGTIGAQWSVAQTGDMNGDGKADILFADTSGNIGAWYMNGKTIAATTIYGNIGTQWSVQSLNSQ